jgi:hypothetical protein
MSWDDLNERQQRCLNAIYAQDQENERYEKQAGWEPGMRTRPAAEWRWMEYGIEPATGDDSPLRYRLRVAQLVDPGTGATFGALETRGYIECSYAPVVGGDLLVLIRITRRGRKLVRANLGEQRERPLPPGTLRPWHWKALGALWESRPDGLRGTGGMAIRVGRRGGG